MAIFVLHTFVKFLGFSQFLRFLIISYSLFCTFLTLLKRKELWGTYHIGFGSLSFEQFIGLQSGPDRLKYLKYPLGPLEDHVLGEKPFYQGLLEGWETARARQKTPSIFYFRP